MADLKPCPFCASIGQYSTSKENAVRAWNTRKPIEAVVAELEKQVEQYDRRAEEHKDYEDYHARYWAKKCSYEHAIEIVRGKEQP